MLDLYILMARMKDLPLKKSCELKMFKNKNHSPKDLISKDCGFIFILILARILWQDLRR